MHHQELWGLLVSHHAEPRPYSQEELQVVQLLADQVSIAIAQAELLEQARQKAQQERLINQIAALVYSPLHPETTLTTVLEQLAAGLQGIGARLRIHFMGADTLCCHGVQPRQATTPGYRSSSEGPEERGLGEDVVAIPLGEMAGAARADEADTHSWPAGGPARLE